MAERYAVSWQPKALKALRRIDNSDGVRLILASQALGNNPFPANSRPVVGPDDVFRIQVGPYRLLYTVEKAKLLILVLTVGHRRDVYRLNLH
ncbi:MAG: type II toxin-antitoxin system RelE/ParE family toxin [Microbacteriaceae bacterium]|nr:type II toxin-antitoxin system RelE/ParE family toxin [Microbacteriaceae bacterium]